MRSTYIFACASLVGAGAVTDLAAQDAGGPVSLQEAIQSALARSDQIDAAEQSVRIADQQVREAWANVMPDVAATASYQRNLQVQQGFLPAIIFDPNASPNDVIPVRFGSDNTWNAGFTLNQKLFEWDVFIGVGAANRFRNLEGERMRGTTQDVVTNVRQRYLEALLAKEDVRLTRESVERVRQTLEETRAMNRAGLSSSYDVLRLEVELANLEPNLMRAENALGEAKRSLLIELGREPAEGVTLVGSLNEMEIDDPQANTPENLGLISMTGLPLRVRLDPSELSSVAMEQRSDLRQQRLAINLERTRLASQKAEYLPTLGFFTNYNVTAQENGSPTFFGDTNTRTTSAVTGISISLPIFQGFSRDSRVQQTRATVEQNSALLERAEKEAENELQSTLANLSEARQRVASQRRAVEQAGRGFEIASAEYRNGVGSQLQVTDAELALRQSEFNYAQAIYDYLSARTRLDAALGTVPTEPGDLGSRLERGDR